MSVSTNSDFFLEFMEPLIGGIWDLIKGIGNALIRIFNIANYIDIINNHSGVSPLIVIISIISLLILFGLIAFLLYRLVRRLIRFRHNVHHQETLVDEIESLNNDVAKLRAENERFKEMANEANNEEVEYDENGNVISKANDSRFYKLTKIDEDYANFVKPNWHETIELDALCEQFRNYAASKLHLYYDINLIRLFVSAFASNRLIILQGISGTGKTSLAYAWGYFVKNESTIASVQPSWRDSTEIYGYFNEFTKRFNETQVLAKMYEARYNPQIYLTVLDEMNISRVEYYFAEMLSVLELPSTDEWIISLVPNAWPNDPKLLEEGRFRIPNNMWYCGTINNDDSTFMVTDKVYDRALPINIDNKSVPFEAPDTEPLDITAEYFESLFKKAWVDHPLSNEVLEKINKMDEYVINHFRMAFGNRILKQIKDYVPVFVACGGDEMVAVDYLIANKILRKFNQLNLAYIRGEIDGFKAFLDDLFGQDVMKECKDFLDRLKKQM